MTCLFFWVGNYGSYYVWEQMNGLSEGLPWWCGVIGVCVRRYFKNNHVPGCNKFLQKYIRCLILIYLSNYHLFRPNLTLRCQCRTSVNFPIWIELAVRVPTLLLAQHVPKIKTWDKILKTMACPNGNRKPILIMSISLTTSYFSV